MLDFCGSKVHHNVCFVNSIYYINSAVCPSVQVPILVSGPRQMDRTLTDGQDQVLKSRSGGLPRVNTRVFVFVFFFSRPFSTGWPGLITGVFFFLSALFGRTAQG
jgi:hypothetical protein